MPTLTDNDKKRAISEAYIAAISAKAGVAFALQTPDVESQDCMLTYHTMDAQSKDFKVNLCVQLKSTSSVSMYTIYEDRITYKLNMKNYNDLISSRTAPIILGLLIIPDYEECIEWEIEKLILHCTMYWVSLFGLEKKETNAVGIKIPITQTLKPQSLIDIMDKIARGEDL